MKKVVFAIVAVCVATSAQALDLQGHRGARGLQPENTLPAFAKALSLGVTTLELDVLLTQDKVLVVAHDPVLQPKIVRGPDGNFIAAPGPTVKSLTWPELQRFDVGRINPADRYARQFKDQMSVDGARIPTLQAVFDLVRKSGNADVQFAIETKLSPKLPDETFPPETIVEATLAVLRAEGMLERTSILSFDWRTLKLVNRLAPEVPTVCLSIQRGSFDNIEQGRPGQSPWTAGLDIDEFGGSLPKLVKAAGCTQWSGFHRDVTPERIKEAQALGLKVLAWTVNNEADMERLIDAGVDGIVTDYPDRLRKVMAARGMKLPPATPVSSNP